MLFGASLVHAPLTSGKPQIDDAPKRNHCSSFLIEEIFKETRFIERQRIRIPLSVFAEFGNPITWLMRIDNREELSRIKKGSAGIVQDAQIVRFDPDDNIWLTKCEVTVTRVSFLQFDDHSLFTRTCFTRECAYPSRSRAIGRSFCQ